MTEQVKALGVGVPGENGSAELGGITSPPQLDIIERHVNDAVDKGARVLAGAESAYSSTNQVRDLMIAYATAKGTIDPSTFAATNWKLTQDGTPVF